MGLQSDYDLQTATDAAGDRLKQEVMPLSEIENHE